jgi:toxin ParE1/3/4
MKVSVLVTEDAQRDLDDIHAYIVSQDGLDRADAILDGLGTTLSKLTKFPNRGEYPPELAALGIRQFRQVHYKPYRAIYQVTGSDIHVLVVADGRRDLQALLQRRLLAR